MYWLKQTEPRLLLSSSLRGIFEEVTLLVLPQLFSHSSFFSVFHCNEVANLSYQPLQNFSFPNMSTARPVLSSLSFPDWSCSLQFSTPPLSSSASLVLSKLPTFFSLSRTVPCCFQDPRSCSNPPFLSSFSATSIFWLLPRLKSSLFGILCLEVFQAFLPPLASGVTLTSFDSP